MYNVTAALSLGAATRVSAVVYSGPNVSNFSVYPNVPGCPGGTYFSVVDASGTPVTPSEVSLLVLSRARPARFPFLYSP